MPTQTKFKILSLTAIVAIMFTSLLPSAFAQVIVQGPQIANVTVSKTPFNPNEELVTFQWDLLGSAAQVSFHIYDRHDNTPDPIRTLKFGSPKTIGSDFVKWDGKNEAGNLVNAAVYDFKIVAYNPNTGYDEFMGTVEVFYPAVVIPVPTFLNHSANPTTINPDLNQTSTISWNTNIVAATTTVQIVQNNNEIRTLLLNSASGQTSGSAVWYGTNNSNIKVTDGTYYYLIRICNAANQCSTATGPITVSRATTGGTLPIITNDYATPNPFNPSVENTRIYWNLNVAADVTVEIFDGSTRIRTLLDNVAKTAGQNWVVWDGRDRFGNTVSNKQYTYIITATNSAGSDTETGTVTVNRDSGTTGNLISNVRVTNPIFNPNRNERAQLCFDVLNDNTRILVEVLDGNTVIRTLLNNVEINQTTNRCVTWDGRNSSGNLMRDAVYQFRIRAERGTEVQVEHAYMELDTDGIIIGFPDANFCGGFTDIPANSPFCKALALLYYKGVFTGYPDGTFRLHAPINRAEVVKVVLLALDYNILSDDGTNLGFWDVIRRSWYMPYLRTARVNGIIHGYPDGSFRPESSINRVELLKVFLEASDITIPRCNVAPYPDTPVDYLTRWYIDYACFAKAFGLMRTDANGNFNPAQPMTRGDVVDLFYQFEKRGLFADVNWTYYNSYYTDYNPYYYYSPTYPVYYY
jgi:flagellar hook assembly protein FlgD